MHTFVIPIRSKVKSRVSEPRFNRPADEIVSQTNKHDEIDEDEAEDEDVSDEEPTQDFAQSRIAEQRSLRQTHLNVLVTLLHRCILDADWERAERAYGLLLRSKGVDIRLCHDLGLQILSHTDPTGARAMQFMARLIVAYPPIKARRGKHMYDRADVFVRILTDLRIKHKQYRTALQELEGWLLVPPYKNDKLLWKALLKVCEILQQEASSTGDRLEVHRLEQRRVKAEAKVNDVDDLVEDEH